MILFDKTQAIQLIESDPKIVVLYNCLKILLGMKKISSSLQNVLGRVEEMCGLAAKNTLEDHILQIFIAIKKMIFKKDDLVQFDEEDSIDG